MDKKAKPSKGEWTFADTCGTCSMPVFWRKAGKFPEVLRYCAHGIQASPVYGPGGTQVWKYPNVIYANSSGGVGGGDYSLTTNASGGGNGSLV